MILRLVTLARSPLAVPAGALALTVLLCAKLQAGGTSPSGDTEASPTKARSAEALLQQAINTAKLASTAEQQPLERADIRTTPAKTPGSRPSGALPSGEMLPGDAVPPASTQPQIPSAPASPNKAAAARPGPVSAPVRVQDPRTRVPGERVDPSAYEPTALTVSRVFISSGGADQPARKISVAVPVYYETRLLGIEKDKQRAAARLLARLHDFQRRVAAMQQEGSELLKEWNEIVNASVPRELLMADSPSLVENQGGDAVNRPVNQPGFEPGKNVVVQLKKTTEQHSQ